ncbi:MAG TPA: hypothetical protein VNT01_17910 [Symbiobacteriaceae bacterium]|nr:hypothetical protein [Symbiobacteriaceae bacterium]
MNKLLTEIRFRRHDVSAGGALGSLLTAAGRDLPLTYILGASGHAFRLTLDLVVSPMAPYEINFHEQFPLWENLGAWFKRTTDRDEALQRFREATGRGLPAIGFDLAAQPEYGLVIGYDDDRLACLTAATPAEPVWMEAETWPPDAHAPWTRAEAITLLDLAPAFDRRRAEVASLRFAVEHFWAPASRDMWLQHGKGAYDFWISTLASPLPLHGPDPGLGHSYNLRHLLAARREAAAYLAEVGARYPEAPSLQAAALRYGEVVSALEEGLPSTALASAEQRKALAGCLRRALAAEQQGVDEIERSLRALR